jgi:hypothetical protein
VFPALYRRRCELGALSNINVSLPAVMGRFELELPTDPDALRHAIQASLRLIDLAPAGASFPLRAASCRAVLGNADFSVHVVGEAGALKSELAALEQQHFGRTTKSRGTMADHTETIPSTL